MSVRSVTIVDYRIEWPREFDLLKTELQARLSKRALGIDHIGSTAVPALAAKDVIDIQVTVNSLSEGIIETMLAAGFTIHGDPVRHDHLPPGFAAQGQEWMKLFFMQRVGARRANIHVRELRKPNQRYALLVRDFLRANPSTAQAYGELKVRLACALTDPDAYPEVKDPVSDIIYLAAERWAQATHWHSPCAAAAQDAGPGV